MTDDFDQRTQKAAENVLAMMAGVRTTKVLLASLRLAYATGYRDCQHDRLMEQIARDNEMNERTG